MRPRRAGKTPKQQQQGEEEEGAEGDEPKQDDDAAAPAPASSSSGRNDANTLFVKNLNFETREAELRKHFGAVVGADAVRHVTIPRKKAGPAREDDDGRAGKKRKRAAGKCALLLLAWCFSFVSARSR